MHIKKYLVIFYIFVFYFTNIKPAFWDDSGAQNPSTETFWDLSEKDIPTEPELLEINSKNLENIFDITQKNIELLNKKIDEWNKYIPSIESRIEQLKKERKNNNLKIAQERINGYKKKLDSLKQEIENQQTLRTAALNKIVDNKALDEKIKIESDEKIKDREAQIQKTVQGIQTFINESLKKENLTKVAAFAIGTTAGTLAAYYASKLTYNYLEILIDKPTLVRESNRINLKQKIKNLWLEKILGKKIEAAKIEDVILPADLKSELNDLAQDTKKTVLNKLNFRNVLFYGVPGTGKTMFAKLLAKFCKMDYAILSGADFAQFKPGKDIEELHNFFDWAQNSPNGLIVFIDESDSFLKNRKKLENNAINLVNAFLSRTGESSDKIMFIFATNHPEDLDPAVLSRIHKKINFPLPGADERRQLIELYIKKYILDDKKFIKINGEHIERHINISPEINQIFINNLAQKTNGLSGRDISQAVQEMQICAYNRGNGILSKEIAEKAIAQKIKEFNQEKNYIQIK
jgi:ATPase family AAA domain-containing protein 3A/B